MIFSKNSIRTTLEGGGLRSTRLPRRWPGICVILALVTACGGGGDGNSDGAPTGSIAPPAQITSISISLSATALAVGQTRTMTAEAKDQNGNVMSGVQFAWTSSNSSVASVLDGVATGAAAGSADITASSAGVTSSPATLTVIVVAKGSVAIDKASVFFTAPGQSAQLQALASDPQSTPSAGAITWTSSAPDKVSVDATGHLIANTIGSTLITAESSGVKSAPTLVVVATPQAGALLVTDAQVLSVGLPLAVDPSAPAPTGVQYDVTLQGVAAPLPGTVLLAAETAPVAGKVVATRPAGGNVVVTLAVVPLYELFSNYDLDWNIDLTGFPIEAPPAPSAQAARRVLWDRARQGRMQALAAVGPRDVLSPFSPFDCEASIKPEILDKKFSMSLDRNVSLVIRDRPGYSRHSLEGSATLNGSASVLLKAGFKGSGRCDATAQIKLPVLGWLNVVVMPGVRIGFGAEISGEVVLVQGELGVDGKLGFNVSLGWECSDATTSCTALDTMTPIRGLTMKGNFPSGADWINGIEVRAAGHFYALAGFGAVLFGGVGNAKLIDARTGPKQSFDLAVETAQAILPEYASSYDLKLVTLFEPGSALKAALEAVYAGGAAGLVFPTIAPVVLSESPKGTLSLSKTRVAVNSSVDFTVALDPKTLSYDVIGYNVAGVQLYRKRDDEESFSFWKDVPLVASNQASYTWKPELTDAGKYKIAAFVNTEIQPLPWLEVAPNSVQEIEVSCFSASATAAASVSRAQAQTAANGTKAKSLANDCADTWAGISTFVGNSSIYTARADVVWSVNPLSPGSGTTVLYVAEGSVDITVIDWPTAGCTGSPTHFTFDRNDPLSSTFLNVTYYSDGTTATYGGGGQLNRAITVTCPNNSVFVLNQTFYWFSSSGGQVVEDGLAIDVSGDTIPQPGFSFHFARP